MKAALKDSIIYLEFALNTIKAMPDVQETNNSIFFLERHIKKVIELLVDHDNLAVKHD